MGDVLTFTPRPKPTAPEALPPLAGADLRASLEEAAQTALDAADRIIAVLDRLEGDPDIEDGVDAEPPMAAPENHEGSQGVFMPGNDQDREIDTPEVLLPKVLPDPTVIRVPPIRWAGRGNIVAAMGVALLDLAKVR